MSKPLNTPRDFGVMVRNERRRRNWTQNELAKRATVSRPWLSQLEKGKPTVELGRCLAVLSALELTLTTSPLPQAATDLEDYLTGFTDD